MHGYNEALTSRQWLLVEDNAGDVDLVREHLADVPDEVRHLEVVGTMEDAREALGDGPFEVILLDLGLPGSTGLETVDRAVACAGTVPVVVLTGTSDEHLGTEAVARGAADFIPKNELSGRLLSRSVRYAVERSRRHEVEVRFRSLVESSRDLVSILDRDLSIRYVSPSVKQVLGYDPQEKHGTDASLEVHPEDRSGVMEDVGRLLDDSRPVSRLRYRVRHRDGSWRVLETIAQDCFDDPHIRGLVLYSRDITEDVEQERQLRFQADLLDEVGQPILAVNEEGRITYWNDACEEVTGWKRSEVEGKESIGLLVAEEDQERAIEGRRAAQRGQKWQDELRFRTKSGETRIVRVSVSPASRADESPAGRIVAGVDITELRRAEEESRQAAERLRLQAEMLEAVGQAVVATDPAGLILYWNRAAEELYGWSADEVMGRHVMDVTPSDSSREQAEEVMASLQAGETWTGEFEVQRRDGSTFPALVTDAPMLDEEGRLTAIIGVSSDLTERLELEQQLRQAQRMEAVGRLAGGIAHDFNNLLTAIEGHASMLVEQLSESSSLLDDAEEIRKAGRRAGNLTRQLLAFSRRQVLQAQRIDLGNAAEDMEKMLRRLVPERIGFDVETPRDPVAVEVDPGQLDQVIVNLVVNAADAIEETGSITVAVDAVDMSAEEATQYAWAVEPGTYGEISVSDSGVGMTQEVLDQVFEPFFTTKGEGRGTGLGLATVYGIVKQSGGHVFLDSEPGVGTTVRVLLPVVAEVADDRPEDEGASSPETTSAVVLLVEDDDAVRKIARKVLERAGHTVVEAGDGEQAMAVADQPIDIVVSDVVMPSVGGVELQRRLSEQNPDLKVVLTSGYSESEVHTDVRQLGAAFLPKPYTPAELRDCVADTLAR